MTSELSNERGDSYRLATSKRGDEKYEIQKKSTDINDLKQELDISAHRIPLNELLYELETDADVGLTEELASERLRNDGPNVLTPIDSTPDWVLFFKNIFGGFNLLLWIGVVLCFIAFGIQAGSYEYKNLPMDNLYLAVVLLAIVILSSVFLFIQERKSAKVLRSFERLVPYKATVIRNGFTYEMLAHDLVIGDIVTVKFGDRIPADIRIITATSFKVDNSALTGESEAQVRTPEYTNENSLETKNLAFYSTNAVEGSCKGVVIAIGDGTVIGRIANLANSLDLKMTPIAKEINLFIYIISTIAVILSLIFIILAFILGYYWIDSIMYLIGIIIACVPEGLLATVTICLTLTAKRMAKKNCLVKNLEAVETLGSTSVICCDKTGTLTQNKMTVSSVCFDNAEHDVDLSGDVVQSNFDINSSTWKVLCRAAMLCNHSIFIPRENQEEESILNRPCTGDSSESALFKFMEIAIGDVQGYRDKNIKLYEMPFNSTNKYQFTVHKTGDNDVRFLMVMKGAPEKILDLCQTFLLNGSEFQLDEKERKILIEKYNTLGESGERVIAYADKRLDEDKFNSNFVFEEEYKKIPISNLRFIGYIAMMDPPRPAVPEAIEKCRTAGIKVIMVTGDHPVTAKAVARAVGIISESNKTVAELAIERGVAINDIDERDAKACVIHGHDLNSFLPEELDKIIVHHEEIVFARTTPQQKLLIVESCQRLGYIVAVTGDGVNDSPALKQADIGISMGISGSDVSKQAADMILLDDNFASVVTGVEEGRLIFDNLKKSICYTLTSNIPEVMPFILFIVLGLPLPLGTITVLLIDLGTDLYSSISLVYEEAESDIMRTNPRNPQTDKLVSHRLLSMAYGQIGIIEAAAGFFTYFIVMSENGFWPQRLIALRQEWDSLAINDVADSYGQEWSYHQRKYLEFTCQGAFFVTIVMCQWANLVICKTRRNSIFTQGMWNHHLTFALFLSATLAMIFIYVPGLNVGLRVRPLRFTWWLPALPYVAIIFIYDELRKFIIRCLAKRHSGPSWIERESYY